MQGKWRLEKYHPSQPLPTGLQLVTYKISKPLSWKVWSLNDTKFFKYYKNVSRYVRDLSCLKRTSDRSNLECFFFFLIYVRPSPTITWKKDGELIQHEESTFKISRSFYGRRLFIHNVDKEQHEGTYTCEAQNDLNTENPLSFNFRLNVEGKRNFLQPLKYIDYQISSKRKPTTRRQCAPDS